MVQLPAAFCQRMRQLLGDQYEAFEASYEKERVQGLRLNRLKLGEGEPDWLSQARKLESETGFRLTPVPWVREGFYYGDMERENQGTGGQDQNPGGENQSLGREAPSQRHETCAGFATTADRAAVRPGKHPYHEAGVYYIQEPSAMSVVELLDPRPGETVLDLCAAPGGKTSHIASRLGGEGLLLSNEIHPARAKILSQNVERMGITQCVVASAEPGELAGCFPEFFDKIAVDAPCSGEGMFRKDQQAAGQWSPDHVAMCAARQQDILKAAAAMLKPGGRLVYSTCTFAPEENEGAILHFLETHPSFSVEHVNGYEGFTPGCPQWLGLAEDPYHLEWTFRIFPHKLEGEGHYMAVLKKREGTEAAGPVKACTYLNEKKRRELLKDYEDFCRENLAEPELFLERREYILFGEQLYLVPAGMPDMAGLKVLRPGLHLGTLKKNRFEPSHALALALRPEQAKLRYHLSLENGQAQRYLKGETLAPEDSQAEAGSLAGRRGWVLVCVGGYSLGWAKLAGATLKNHYPKGLRWM